MSPRPAELLGSFDIQTLLCELFRRDLDPLADSRENDDRDRLDFSDILRIQVSVGAQHDDDAFVLGELPEDLSSETRANLFHERIHYWQLLSCSKQQIQYTLLLEKLRVEVTKAGGRAEFICGQTAERPPTDKARELDAYLASCDSQFLPPIKLDDVRLELHNLVRRQPITDMPLLKIPHRMPGLDLPAFGAVLGFLDRDDLVLVPFVGQYLLETAAHVSELLHIGRELPNYDRWDDSFDVKYTGIWEFWRRCHGHRYGTTEELALGLLAVIDLSMFADVLENSPDSFIGDEYYEVSSIPYRFGKLAYSSQAIPPLRLNGRAPAEAVAEFQDALCRMRGYTAPATVARKMALFLTRLLVQACYHGFPDDPDIIALAKQLLTAPLAEAAERFYDFAPLWRLLGHDEGRSAFGHLVLGSMLNSCVFRLEHPGKLALPHLYADELTRNFPLPLLMLDGKYYYDETGAGEFGRPYFTNAMRLARDCVRLMTIEPFRRGRSRCGFLDNSIRCFYMQLDLGCPQAGLSETEREVRRSSLPTAIPEGFCHWSISESYLRVPPESASRPSQGVLARLAQLFSPRPGFEQRRDETR